MLALSADWDGHTEVVTASCRDILVTSLGDDLPRSPTGRTPQWVRDEAEWHGTPGSWAATPTSHPLPAATSPLRENSLSTIVVAILLAASMVWVAADHLLQSDPPSPVAGTSRAFRFSETQPGQPGVPVTFSSCHAIRYVVRPDNAPPGGAKLIARAVASVSAATGLRFINEGATSEPLTTPRPAFQPTMYGDRWAPVLIGWATVEEEPGFEDEAVGKAFSYTVSRPDGSKARVSGAVVVDAAYAAETTEAGSRRRVQAVLEHELGHLVGLDHVRDPTQIMYRSVNGVDGYQSGDLTGLAALGRGPCFADV